MISLCLVDAAETEPLQALTLNSQAKSPRRFKCHIEVTSMKDCPLGVSLLRLRSLGVDSELISNDRMRLII